MISEERKMAVIEVAEAVGIRGVVAILSAWAGDQGGLEFVKRCIYHLTEAEVAESLAEDL